MGDQGPFGFSGREWRIVLPLSFAAFFENYDYALVSIAAPVISAGLGVSSSEFGVVVSVIRLAGRRRWRWWRWPTASVAAGCCSSRSAGSPSPPA